VSFPSFSRPATADRNVSPFGPRHAHLPATRSQWLRWKRAAAGAAAMLRPARPALADPVREVGLQLLDEPARAVAPNVLAR
jgi:hypothetical protein